MERQNFWASSVFKGRIGEAIVESVLLESGYKVDRIGQEFGSQRFTPDLLVRDPNTKNKTYVEVKLRTARPMSVHVEKKKLELLRRYYPQTILIFVSSYNGSVNCAKIRELTSDEIKLQSDGFYEFDLFSDHWKPIWHFFPLVKPGERLTNLWTTLKEYMHTFAKSKVQNPKKMELIEGEREELLGYIEESWNPHMLQHDILIKDIEKLSLRELREKVLEINAFLLALDLNGEENIATIEFQKTLDKVRGRTSEKYVAIDVHEISELLRPYPDLSARFTQLIKDQQDAHSPGLVLFLEELYNILPPGLGKALLTAGGTSLNEALEIDLRTALALAQRRNCLDTLDR